ncbi:MAG: DMT family transporter [Alphaproteobacteria bacterium]
MNSGRSPDRIFAGIVCVEIGMILFSAQDAMMKVLLGDFTVWMLIAARGGIAVALLLPLILILGAPHRLKTPLWPVHVFRGFLFSVGFSCTYAAFPLLPLAKVMTIFFTAPLLITVFAVVFLGERIGLHRIAALLIGFIGIVVAINPTLDGFDWVVLLPLVTAVAYAFQQTLSRWLGNRETSMTLGLYSLASAAVFILPLGYGVNLLVDTGAEFRHLRWDWWVPSLNEAGLLFILGANGMVAMLLLWRAYQIAPAGVIAPFDYSYLVWAVLIGYFLFDEVPSINTVVGMVLIASSGLYLGFREMLQMKRNRSIGPTSEAVILPSNTLPEPSPSAGVRDRNE